MLKISRCGFVVAVLAVAAIPASAGELKLTLNNGLVSVVANDVPVSQILAEWARIGQTKIVNGEKLTTIVSLQLVDVPEKKALEIVLRSASGFMAAERKDMVAGASTFDRIMILPFSQAPAFSQPLAQTTPQPFVNRPVVAMPEFEEATQPVPGPQQPVSVPLTLPQPGMLPQPPAPGVQPAPTTSPRPGFLPQPLPPKPPGGGGGSDR